MKTASDVMTKHVVDIEPEATVAEAIEKMKQWNVTSLLVGRQGTTDTWGFMTQTDVIEKVVAEGNDPEEIRVHEIMTKPVMTVAPEMDIRYCARLFEQFGLSRAPVEEGGKIIGIVSLTDMVLKGLCQNL